MISTKKINLNKLKFYTVDDAYIKLLSDFDKHVAYKKMNKDHI